MHRKRNTDHAESDQEEKRRKNAYDEMAEEKKDFRLSAKRESEPELDEQQTQKSVYDNEDVKKVSPIKRRLTKNLLY